MYYGAMAQTAQSALRDFPDARFGVPLWLGRVTASSFGSAQWTAGVWAWIDFAGVANPFTGSLPGGCPSDADVVPILLGFVETRQAQWISPTVFEASISFTEASPPGWAVRPNTAAFTAGLVPSGSYATAPKIFDLPYNAGASAVWSAEIPRAEIGFGRERPESNYTHLPRLSSSILASALNPSEVSRLVRFWFDHSGGKPFWAPLYGAAGEITADVSAGATTIQCRHSLASNSFALAGSVSTWHLLKAASTTSTSVTATAPLPALQSGVDLLVGCYLARLESDSLTIKWAPSDSSAKINWVDCKSEYGPDSGETIGQTIGATSAVAFLYRFTRIIDGASVVDRFTSWESDLTHGGNLFAHIPIHHGEVDQGLDLDPRAVTVTTHTSVETPILLACRMRAEAPIKCEILQVDVAAGVTSSERVIAVGDLVQPHISGFTVSAQLVPGGVLMDRRVPQFVVQAGCNWTLFRGLCGLLKSNWTFTATVSNPGTPGFPHTFELSGLARSVGAAPTYTADYFAGGSVIFGSGATSRSVPILRSSTPSSGVISLTLPRDPDPFPIIGENARLFPGCDGRAETCKTKFSNYANFGGHPFVPKGNPSLVKLSDTVSGGKK